MLLNWLFVLTLFHLMLLLLYRWFPSLRQFLNEHLGVSVSPLCVHWSVSRATKSSLRLTREHSRAWSAWFNTGALVSILLMMPSLCFLVYNLLQQLQSLRGNDEEVREDERNMDQNVHLVPVVPGINLPLANFGLYVITLVLCSGLHELGHAMAAVQEGVHVSGFGLTIVLVLPAVYVETQTDQLLALSRWRQLKIFCAGVWHNCVLALSAFVMFAILTSVCKPFFLLNPGLSVVSLNDDSIKGHLDVGDIITDVNGCIVKNELDWRHCMHYTTVNAPLSFCVDEEKINQSRSFNNETNCCPEEVRVSNLCFLSLKDSTTKACLPVRETLRTSSGQCNASSPCLQFQETCMQPVLDEPNGRLVKLTRLHTESLNASEPYLYVGDPRWLYGVIDVSEFVPRFKFVSTSMLHGLETLLSYLVSFSAALALLNVVPCVMLDGQHIMRTLVNALLVYRIDRSARDNVCVVITLMGTLILAANVVLGLLMLIRV